MLDLGLAVYAIPVHHYAHSSAFCFACVSLTILYILLYLCGPAAEFALVGVIMLQEAQSIMRRPGLSLFAFSYHYLDVSGCLSPVLC